MPAYKCDNGKYRWGATGSCKYNSKQEAEDDNKDYYRALTDIDLTPTQGMIDEAKKGLEWRKEFGSTFFKNGAKPSSVLSTDRALSETAIERLKNSFNSSLQN